MTSRIGKLLCETTGAARLADADALRSRDIALVVADTASPTLVRSAVALSLRCFTGTVYLRSPPGARLPGALAAAAEEEAAEYDAGERVRIGESGGDLAVGLGHCADDVFVDAHGWTVSVNSLAPRTLEATAPAAAFAAAAGFAKLFARLMGRGAGVLAESWSATMLDLPLGATTKGASIDVGRVMVIGAGAIGSGLGHVLRGSGWRGDLVWVDHDRYDEPNHETTLLISPRTAIRQAPKAATLADLLRSALLAVEPHAARIIAGHALLSEPADAIVCAVDNSETRRCLDDAAARVLFNAGVGGSRSDAGHVLWTRHEPEDALLSTLYAPTQEVADGGGAAPDDVVTDECSRIAYARISMAAPFMGLAAGALLAAGLAQRALGVPATTNYMKFDLLGLQRWSTRQSLRRAGLAA